MSGFRVTDRSTGEPVVEPDPQVAAPPRLTLPSERPVVLPGAAPSTVRGRTAVEVIVAGWQFELEVEDAGLAQLRERATGGRDAATHHGPTEVRAIIPGRVVSVVVVVGDEVTAGQRLLAVEAMKMENELRAPRDGTVERVTVSVGQTVELGDALVVIR
ncbi:MAG: hypothetical protein QOI37_1654 [Chloroflexota bacterium]|jgi:biotin carboxyl carrier protein|nr:hypothetical protein [Chloroflexota bacterium]